MLQCHDSVIKTTENFERGGGKRRRRGITRGKLDKLITGYTMVNRRLSKHKPDKIQRHVNKLNPCVSGDDNQISNLCFQRSELCKDKECCFYK